MQFCSVSRALVAAWAPSMAKSMPRRAPTVGGGRGGGRCCKVESCGDQRASVGRDEIARRGRREAETGWVNGAAEVAMVRQRLHGWSCKGEAGLGGRRGNVDGVEGGKGGGTQLVVHSLSY